MSSSHPYAKWSLLRLALALAALAALALAPGCGSSAKRGASPDDAKGASSASSDDQGAAAKKPKKKRAHDPVVCAGTDDVELRDVRIEADGVAVQSTESCNIIIVNSEIVASDVAIVVSGGGGVTLRDSVVRGQSSAFAITGSGGVTAKGTRFSGGRVITGPGKFHDRGENTWE